MTFLPHFSQRVAPASGEAEARAAGEAAKVLYADIAGLMDTGGDLLEYINCFVNKKLFNVASRVRFLFPMTFDSIKEERGG